MPAWLIPVIVADVIVTAFVIAFVLKMRVKITTSFKASGVDLRTLLEFSKEQNPRIVEYLRANWSGSQEQLPAVLTALLTQLETEARARGITVSRDVLKLGLATVVRQQHLAPGRDLDEALKQVA